MKFPGHVVVVGLTFGEAAKLFSTTLVPFHIPAGNMSFFTLSLKLVSFLFFMIALLLM